MRDRYADRLRSASRLKAGALAASRLKAGALALCLAALGACALSPAAPAATMPTLTEFCQAGSAADRCGLPRSVAVDPASGNFYLVDSEGTSRVIEFDPWGSFIRAFGADVVSGGAEGSGDLVAGSTKVTSVETTERQFEPGSSIAGDGIAPGTTVLGLGVGTLTLSEPATASGTGVALSVAAGPGNVPSNEVQKVSIGGAPSSGYFKLTLPVGQVFGDVEEGSDQLTNSRLASGSFHVGDAVSISSGEGTGLLSAGSTTVSSLVTARGAFAVGAPIEGNGIQAGTTIAAVGAGTLTLSNPASASGGGIKLTALDTIAAIDAAKGSITLSKNALGFRSREVTETTAPIPHDADAAQVQAALEALPAVGAGNATLSGEPGGPFTVEFSGPLLGDIDIGQMRGAGGLAPAGSVEVATLQGGGQALETCTAAEAASCKAGISGTPRGGLDYVPHSGAGQLAFIPAGVGVDGAGDVYVQDKADGYRVQKFSVPTDPSGRVDFELMFGGEVNKTSGADLCTAASGERCGTGIPGTEEGRFSDKVPSGSSLSVDREAGRVYVGDLGRIEVFDTGGAFLGQIATPEKEPVSSLAFDPSSGDLYFAYANGSEVNYVNAKHNVYRLDAESGALLDTLAVGIPTTLAVDAEGSVYVFDQLPFGDSGNPENLITRLLRFDAKGELAEVIDENESRTNADRFDTSTGLATSSPPTCGLEGTDLILSNTKNTNPFVRLYGPPPDPEACPPPAVAPAIDDQFASSVDSTGAALRAKINPRFWPDARYYVQYGTGKCSEGGCTAERPAAPGSLLTEEVLSRDVASGEVFLEGLEPNTTYHYRFVAQSSGGGPVFGVGGSEEEDGGEGRFHTAPAGGAGGGECPNRDRRRGASSALPDCRAYELVSPLDKNNSDVLSAQISLAQATSDGGKMTFTAPRAFAEPEGAGLSTQYLAERREGDGWATHSISPPRTAVPLYFGAGLDFQYQAFTENLCDGWFLQDADLALVGGAPPGVPNYYRRDLCGAGGFELLSSTPPPGFSYTYTSLYFPEIQGFAADGSSSVFRAPASLAVQPGGPRMPLACSTKAAAISTYSWLRNGTPIADAESSTYLPTEADEGASVQCLVRASDAEGASLAASEALVLAAVGETPPPDPGDRGVGSRLPGTPELSGTPRAGETLTCAPGHWHHSPSFSYRWLRNGAPISGATAASYELDAADTDSAVQCEATGSNAGGASIAISEAALVEALPPAAAGGPTITGSAAVGQALHCGPGSWSNGPSFSYLWLRGGVEMSGVEDEAHGSKSDEYTVQGADEGKALQCRVSATNADATVAALSAAAVVAPPPGTAPPSPASQPAGAGAAEVGAGLSCKAGSWSGEPSFAYQWLRNGAPIAGKTEATYEVVGADRGAALQCRVRASNAGGAAAALSSGRYVAPSPPAATASGRGPYGVYDAYEGGKLRLVSVLPDASTPRGHATVGSNYSSPSHPSESSVYGGVSDDGSRVFFTTRASGLTDRGAGALYLRLNPTQPESERRHGAATGNGDLTGPAAGTGTTIKNKTTISSVVTTSGKFTVGQEIVGAGIPAETTILAVEDNKLEISKPATAVKAGVELTAPASPLISNLKTATGAFQAGQEIAGSGIPAGATVTSVGAGTLTLSAPASGSVAGAALSATSPCTEAAKACTIAVPGATQASFVAADPTGTRVLYLMGSEGSQLYEAQIEEAGEQVVAVPHLIASGVRGAMGASRDARRVYFASEEVLSGAQANGFGETAQEGEPNLYYHEAGAGFVFVATLAEHDMFTSILANGGAPPSPLSVQPDMRTARVSPDGLHAAFTTEAALGGNANADLASGRPDAEVYLFDAAPGGGEGDLLCASCNPGGALPRGRQTAVLHSGATELWAAAQLPGWSTATHPRRVLADNGKRLFFDSYDALVPTDTNGRADVYQWEAVGEGDCTALSPAFSEANEGCIGLISDGQSAADSELLEATPSGSDVFFVTQSSLLPEDYGLRDVYDARVEGGFAGPPAAPAACEGEACQGASKAPEDPTPASESFHGAGNVAGAPARKRCAKGKVKRRGRCVRKHRKHHGRKHCAKGKVKRHGKCVRKRSHKRRAAHNRRVGR